MQLRVLRVNWSVGPDEGCKGQKTWCSRAMRFRILSPHCNAKVNLVDPCYKTRTYVRKGPVEESRSAFVKLNVARPSQIIRVASADAAHRHAENARCIVKRGRRWRRIRHRHRLYTHGGRCCRDPAELVDKIRKSGYARKPIHHLVSQTPIFIHLKIALEYTFILYPHEPRRFHSYPCSAAHGRSRKSGRRAVKFGVPTPVTGSHPSVLWKPRE